MDMSPDDRVFSGVLRYKEELLLLGMFSLSADETRVLCFTKGVRGLILEIGDNEPKVSFFTGLMEMFGEVSDKGGPWGVPKLRVRVLIVCLSCEQRKEALMKRYQGPDNYLQFRGSSVEDSMLASQGLEGNRENWRLTHALQKAHQKVCVARKRPGLHDPLSYHSLVESDFVVDPKEDVCYKCESLKLSKRKLT